MVHILLQPLNHQIHIDSFSLLVDQTEQFLFDCQFSPFLFKLEGAEEEQLMNLLDC